MDHFEHLFFDPPIPTIIMAKNILLNVDDAFFQKMKNYKNKMESDNKKSISWGDFIQIIFGMAYEK